MAAGSPIPSMTQIAMSSTPTLIAAASPTRKRLAVAAMVAAVDVYVGASSTMSSTTGFPIFARAAPFDIGSQLTTGAVYGCCTAGATTTVGVLGY